ncbi:hypothetical protein Tco_0601889 [Tanacetum coccineum]
MSSYNHFGCSWCGGPFNGGNCLGCSSVGSGNEFVYDPNPYSYNETPNFFDQPPQHQYETYSCEFSGGNPHPGFDFQIGNTPVYDLGPCYNQDFGFDQPSYSSLSQPQQFDCCEIRGGPHYSSDCQTRNPLVYEPNPCNNYDFPYFDQRSQFTPPLSLPYSEFNHVIEQFNMNQEQFNLNQVKIKELQAEMNRLQEMLSLRNSNQDPPIDLYDLKGSDEGDIEIDSLTKEPSDTLLMGDEVISTTPERENDEFIKSSVDDLVPIPRESEVTSVCDDLKCDITVTIPLPTTNVTEDYFDINSPLGEYVVEFFMENEDVAGLPRHLIKRLFSHLVKNPSLTKRMSDEPFSDDSKPRSYDATFSNPLFDFNDDSTLCNDNPLFDEEFEDIISLDPLSRLQLLMSSGGKTRVMETPSFCFHHMPSPCLAAYSSTEIPSDESKVHIEVLSVLWGNRLPIPDGLLPLYRSGSPFGDVVKCALARGKAEAVEELHERRLLTVPAAQAVVECSLLPTITGNRSC